MLPKLTAVLLFVLCPFCLLAQRPEIVAIEYFVDVDPGYGNGTLIPVAAPDSLVNTSLNIPTGSLSEGFHTLYIRAKDQNGNWGLAEARPFYLSAPNSLTTAPITAVEYFVAEEKGFGSGKTITITPGPTIDQTQTIATDTLAAGFHTLFVRARDQKGNWGLAEARPFYLNAPNSVTTSPIAAVEYFVDEEKDFGSGKAVTITPGQTVDQIQTIATNSLSVGFHTLFVRARDQNGNWGLAEARPFYLSELNPATIAPITAMEYFVDEEKDFGSGEAITITPGPTVDQIQTIATDTLAAGFHTLFVRARDQNGNWGLAEARPFYLGESNPATIAPITAVEYFVDEEKGFGRGKAIAITPGQTVDQTQAIETDTISAGFHTLFVRARDQNGNWGLAEARPFYLSASNATTVAPLTAVEYFVDKEIGYGKGKAITITSGPAVDQTQAIEMGTLSAGFHTLFIRARDQSGNWGLAEARPFYLSPENNTIISPLSKLEYFYDADSGFGKGRPLSILTSDGFTQTFKLPTSGLKFGRHVLAVRMQNAAGDWSLTESDSFNLVDNPPPAAPRIVKAEPGDRQVKLTWTANREKDFLKYRLYRGTEPNLNAEALIDSVFARLDTVKTVTGLTNNIKYYFKIATVDTVRQFTFSSEMSAVPNLAPVVLRALRDTLLTKGKPAFSRNLNAPPKVFVDPDGDALTYEASSSDSNKARVVLPDSILTVTPLVSGSASIIVTAKDGNGSTKTDTFLVTINEPPRVTKALRDTTLTISVAPLIRDLNASPRVFTDPENNSLTYSVDSNPQNIVEAKIAGSTMTVKPLASGSANLMITAKDGRGGEAADTFKVTVNQPPAIVNALPDTILTLGPARFIRNLTQVFTDPDRDTLKYSSNLTPQGIVSTSITGNTFTVVPVAGGIATITVTANDSRSGAQTDTFKVTVNLPPRVTSPIPDIPLILGGASFTRDLRQVFNDPDDDPIAYFFNSNAADFKTITLMENTLTVKPEAGSMTTVVVTAKDNRGGEAADTFKVILNQPPQIANRISNQTLTLAGPLFTRDLNAAPPVFIDPEQDSLSYEVSSSGPDKVLASLPQGESLLTVIPAKAGSATITIIARDTKGGQTSMTFNVIVNQPPVVTNVMRDTTLTLNKALIVNLTAPLIFTDPDGNPLKYTVASGAPGKVEAAISGIILTLNAKSTGSAVITLTARDDRGGVQTTGFRVDVNQAPIAAAKALPNTTLNINDLSFMRNLNAAPKVFNDPDGDLLTYEVLSSADSIASATISGGARLVVTPKAEGITEITVKANDGRGEITSTKFQVVVIKENRKPIIVNRILDQTLVIDTSFNRDLNVSPLVFNDPDNNALRYLPPSSSAVNVATAGLSGSMLTVKAAAVGNTTITIIGEDPKGDTTATSFKITVVATSSNQAPKVANVILDQTLVVGDTSFTRDLKKSGAPVFADPDSNDIVLTFTAKSTAMDIALPKISGSILTVAPVAAGNAVITLTASDNNGGLITTAFSVTVLRENRTPQVTNPIQDQSLAKGGAAFTRNLNAVFTDPDDEPLAFSAGSSADHVATAKLSGSILTVEPIAVGSTTITVTANDGKEGIKTLTFQATVATGNQPPVAINVLPDQTIKIGSAAFNRDLSISPEVFADANDDTLKFTVYSTAPNVAVTSVIGSVLSVAPGTVAGTALITLTADDNHGGSARISFAVKTVAETQNRAPKVENAIVNQTLNLGGVSFTRDLVAMPAVFTDPDNDKLTYTAVSRMPQIAAVEITEKSVLNVTPLRVGNDTITVTASDGKGGSTPSMFNVTVSGNQPPKVEHVPEKLYEVGESISIVATITDESPLEARLNFRKAGSKTFRPVRMDRSIGSSYAASIAGSDITSKGIEYYIEAVDDKNLPAPRKNFAVPVQINERGESKGKAQPSGSNQTAYRLISMPFDLDKKKPRDVLEDDLGSYNIKKWRFFEFDGSQSDVELTSASPLISEMAPGKAFWLIVKNGGEVFSGRGKSNPTYKPFPIALHSKWNMIGNPFNFSIPLEKLWLKSTGAPPKLRYYEEKWSNSGEVMEIKPFEGYAIYNDRASVDTLWVNPDLSSSDAGTAKAAAATLDTLWSIRIFAQCQQARDEDNLAVVIQEAARGWDELDQPEPPVIGEYVSVFFPHAEWGEKAYVYCTDARPQPRKGEVWEFAVRSNIGDAIQLKFAGLENVPQEYEVWLIDAALHVARNLRQQNHYSLTVPQDETTRLLQLIVGRNNFVEEKLAEARTIPETFELSQNFPNPFNPLTTIRFGVPRLPEKVTLKIFDLLGRQVATLIDQEQIAPGYHTILWDGRNRAGQPVSSGIYVYRLQAGKTILNRKMTMVK